MMSRQLRAKQFMPFDAVKGLQEALRDREEKHFRVERHEISEEDAARLSRTLSGLRKGTRVRIYYYRAFHDVTGEGMITEISTIFRFLCLEGEKIPFENIYSIRIADYG